MHLDENCPVVDTPLKQLTELFSDLKQLWSGLRETAILSFRAMMMRWKLAMMFLLSLMTKTPSAHLRFLGMRKKEAAKIIIVGAGNVGAYVARKLEQRGSSYSVRVIEADSERAKNVADDLNRTIVLHGSGLDTELLTEAGVRDAGLILALTNDDQINILVSLLARTQGCDRALCLINEASFLPISNIIGLDAAINPRSTTVSSVLSHIRKGRVKSVHSVDDGTAEMIEAEVADNSPLVGKKFVNWILMKICVLA